MNPSEATARMQGAQRQAAADKLAGLCMHDGEKLAVTLVRSGQQMHGSYCTACGALGPINRTPSFQTWIRPTGVTSSPATLPPAGEAPTGVADKLLQAVNDLGTQFHARLDDMGDRIAALEKK